MSIFDTYSRRPTANGVIGPAVPTTEPEKTPETVKPPTDPWSGKSYEDMAASFGWNGWNTNNFWDQDNYFSQANQLQNQSPSTAGLRDWMAGQRDAFINPYTAQYRSMGEQQGFGVDAADAGVWADPNFRQFVTTGQGPQGSPAMNSWTGAGTTAPAGNMNTAITQYGDPNNVARRTELYDLLMGRAGQGLNIDRTNPIIRSQADAYSANEERARRNYISDTAERLGPQANIRGEQRMAAERMGQRTGAFEAELMGRELTARRQEISEALSLLGGLLSDDQRLALQRELGLLDNAFRHQSLQSNNDQFAAQLGFNYADRSNYWDSLRRGLL